MKKATYYKIDGHTAEVTPRNGKNFTYEELQNFVGSRIEVVPLSGTEVIVVHEEGKLIGLPMNEKATGEWKKAYPIEKFPGNNDELIVGDALVCHSDFIR